MKPSRWTGPIGVPVRVFLLNQVSVTYKPFSEEGGEVTGNTQSLISMASDTGRHESEACLATFTFITSCDVPLLSPHGS